MAFSHQLNSHYLFENFIAGEANQLARAAATQVVDLLGMIYNPLFIYGDHGVGKTHLIQAIGNQIKSNNLQAKICYVHSERYVSDVVRAYQSNKFEEFKQYYHSLDILLIDDIQFFAGKTKTQEEFFFTFNTLIDSHKQVIMTSDTPPESLSGIDARPISRFSSGLTVAVEPPELEMRAAILLQKAIESGCPIGEDIAYFVAKHVRSDIRMLEGALNMIEARARFYNRPITVDLVNEALFTAPFSKELNDKVGALESCVEPFYYPVR